MKDRLRGGKGSQWKRGDVAEISSKLGEYGFTRLVGGKLVVFIHRLLLREYVNLHREEASAMAALAGSSLLTRPELFGQAIAAPSSSPSPSTASPSPLIVSLLKKKKKPSAKGLLKPLKGVLKSGGELSKWYGPDRRIYLPEGLLDKSEVPAYLTGEVPGDYGFDPFGLSKKAADFDKYQAYELIHARWAMLGAAGFVLPEAFNKYGATCGPEAVWFKTGALLLDGGSLEYFGATVPVNLAVAVIAEVILVGGAEYQRSSNLQGFDRLHPGGPFDPLGLAKDPDQFAILKVKEIKNGRLAMFSMLGFFLQAYVTGEGPVENLSAHLSDPFANNLLTVLRGPLE